MKYIPYKVNIKKLNVIRIMVNTYQECLKYTNQTYIYLLNIVFPVQLECM